MVKGELKKLLTVKDVAKLLSVAQSTVYSWVLSGDIPYYKLGKAIRFKEEDVLQWLELHRRENMKAKQLARLMRKRL